MLTEAEKAWFACALDGEGSIMIDGRKTQPYVKPAAVIAIYNTEIEFLEYPQSIIMREFNESPVISCHHRSVRLGEKRPYCYRVTGFKAVQILKQILPYLIIKKEKALRAIECGNMNRTEFNRLRGQPRPILLRDEKGRFKVEGQQMRLSGCLTTFTVAKPKQSRSVT